MSEEEIINELKDQLSDGKTGCIVFDFGVIPYFDDIDIKISVGNEELPDQKVNHRYINKAYHTVTRKYGRKLSQIGYPYFSPLKTKDSDLELLNITLNYHKDSEDIYKAKFTFPLKVSVTKGKPVCGLSLSLVLKEEDPTITFRSSYKTGDTADAGYLETIYSNKDGYSNNPRFKNDTFIPLDEPELMDNTPDDVCWLIYSTVLEPHAVSVG